MKYGKLSAIMITLLLSVSANVGGAVIVMDEYVTQQSSLTVLSSSFTESYAGALRTMSSPILTYEYVGLLYETDSQGNEYFSGLTQDEQAPNQIAYMFSRAHTYWNGDSYGFWLDSGRSWLDASPVITPDLIEAYGRYTQDAFVELKVRFRVSGDQDSLYSNVYLPGFCSDCIDIRLYDHNTGVQHALIDSSYALEDSHVYTLTGFAKNTARGEADIASAIHFVSDSVSIDEPSPVALLWLGLLSIALIRRMGSLADRG